MAGGWKSKRWGRAAIVMIATGAHIAIATVFLGHEFRADILFEPDILEIELAELDPEEMETPDLIDSEPEPEPDPAPPPATAPPPETEPEPPPPKPAQTPAAAPSVLTQLETAPTGEVVASMDSVAVGSANQDAADAVSAGQVAAVLEKMHCLKLKRHEEGACPPADPFEVAIAAAERDIPPESLFADPRYISLSVSDKRFEREAANRFHWPDKDLFVDPLPPGTNDARRIRNGQEPLWSQDMRDGFRKSDD
ncbi:MAG: hypothetical protein ACE37M_06385 [Henriciella sp.]